MGVVVAGGSCWCCGVSDVSNSVSCGGGGGTCGAGSCFVRGGFNRRATPSSGGFIDTKHYSSI